MAIGRCELDVAPRPRRAGAEIALKMRADRGDTERLIHQLAAVINMRVTITPIASGEDGGEGNG